MTSFSDNFLYHISTKCGDIPKRTQLIHTVAFVLSLVALIFVVIGYWYNIPGLLILTIVIMSVHGSLVFWNILMYQDFDFCLRVFGPKKVYYD
jgi:hypothetical protein